MTALINQSTIQSLMLYFRPVLSGLLLSCLTSCTSNSSVSHTNVTDPFHLPEQAINDTPYKLYLMDIEQFVPAGKSFRPTTHAEVSSPPLARDLTELSVKNLATISAGVAIKIHSPRHPKPLHGYLVFYPIYAQQSDQHKYRIRISEKAIQDALQKKTVRLHGQYIHNGVEAVSWVMWLADQSLDVDCGCL